jgi:hypothetical protein
VIPNDSQVEVNLFDRKPFGKVCVKRFLRGWSVGSRLGAAGSRFF